MIHINKLLLVNKIPYEEFNYEQSDCKYGLINYLEPEDDGYNPGYIYLGSDKPDTIKFADTADEVLSITPKKLILDYPLAKQLLYLCPTVQLLKI